MLCPPPFVFLSTNFMFSLHSLLFCKSIFSIFILISPVFRAEEKDDIMVVIDKYLDLAIHYDYPFVMVKYCVQQMMGSLQDTPQGRFFFD